MASSRRSAAFSGEWKSLTRSIAPQKMRSRKFRFALRAPRLRPARNRDMTSIKLIQVTLLAVILCSLSACSEALPDEPTPEAAKQFLQLRGYQFDEKSFFTAAANRDLIAINGFIAAGMNPLIDRKSTRLNSSHVSISYAVFCLKKKKKTKYRLCPHC